MKQTYKSSNSQLIVTETAFYPKPKLEKPNQN